MTAISAIIITLNEEKNILRCINSLKNVVDEIVVIDSFSTDNTKIICEKAGVKFIQQKWEGYAVTKNKANFLAANDYILSIDADEELSDELQKSISVLKQNELKEVYCFNRLTNYCGGWIRHGGWYPDVKIRLFNRHEVKWKALVVHEHIELLKPVNEFHLSGDLLHYSFTTVEQHREKIKKYAVLEAEKIKHKPKIYLWLKLISSPPFTFIKMYILKSGWLDGASGFTVARLSGYASFMRYKNALS